MTEEEMLTRLVERAGTIQGNVTEDGQAVAYYSDEGSVEYLSLNDLLFGDNLSFLKALIPEGFMGKENWRVDATKLVVMPDAERISWLYKEVFPEDQTG